MSGGHLTLHLRLVKACNADCSYCSSWQENPHTRMSPEQFARALSFVRDVVVPYMGCGGFRSTVSLQYVGGEILLVPKADLRECVYLGREIMAEAFGRVIDGVQSNLVGSERRVLELDTLFGGNVGTSVDGRGNQRTIKGNPDAYRKIVERSMQVIERRRRRRPGAVFVVDGQGSRNAAHEVEVADRLGYPLVLRAIFQGGRSIENGSMPDLVEAFCKAFDQWALKARVPVEPFTHLLTKRVGADAVYGSVCPFQRNCAGNSVNIEPDGTLYTCFEMADSGHYSFGNALEGRFDKKTWEALDRRRTEIDAKCRNCPWFDACQGGCMNEAIHDTGSLYGRPELCEVWTALFRRIDALIAEHGKERIRTWLSTFSA
jgi:radical SAM protein with 4Fe4S-binding SPASM domain|nr:SPASM domain-containing protein [Neorhizobium tomejilense]